MDVSQIRELANEVHKQAATIAAFFEGPATATDPARQALRLPESVIESIQAAIAATTELKEHFLGPIGYFVELPQRAATLSALTFVRRFEIASIIPAEEPISYADIASRIALDESDVRRMLRLAISDGLFQELRPDHIGHNNRSMILNADPTVAGWADSCVRDQWPAFLKLSDALAKWPGSQSQVDTAYTLVNGCDPFTAWEREPQRAKSFADGMNFLHRVSGWQPQMVLQDDDPILVTGGLLVDIGGSSGHASIAMAEHFPSMRFIVQDMSQTIEAAKALIPPHMQSRITLMVHDFWSKPQPVYGADIYYLRWILHDWSDEGCVSLLQNIVPALKHGARIVIQEPYTQTDKVGASYLDSWSRTTDMMMKALTNGKVRSLDEWEPLFKKADPRFVFVGVRTLGARHANIEARWEPGRRRATLKEAGDEAASTT